MGLTGNDGEGLLVAPAVRWIRDFPRIRVIALRPPVTEDTPVARAARGRLHERKHLPVSALVQGCPVLRPASCPGQNVGMF